MHDPFEIRRDRHGWTVFDTATGTPAVLNGRTQEGLPFKYADDVADFLSELVRACPAQAH
jgi:hypothetical protein